jgi:hypothetical protein
MRAARLCALLPLFLCLGELARTAHTAAPAGRPADKAPGKEVPFEVRLDDQSVVRVHLLQSQITVHTPYGKLTVPAADVRQIDFGHHPPAGTDRRVREAIEQLASKTFAAREAAGKQLLALGPLAYEALQKATKNPDLEVVRRAKDLLKKLESLHPEERLMRKPHDLVHTPTFVIAGKVEGATLKVKTAYFGESQLKLADLWSLRALDGPSAATVLVDSARHAIPGNLVWLQTEVEVRKGGTLHVVASGQIDMYPIGADTGQWMAGPGGPKWGGRGGVMGAGPQPGTLVGRIGKSGKEFVIGERLEEKARDDGRLFLRIVPSPWGNGSTGEYKAVVTVK